MRLEWSFQKSVLESLWFMMSGVPIQTDSQKHRKRPEKKKNGVLTMQNCGSLWFFFRSFRGSNFSTHQLLQDRRHTHLGWMKGLGGIKSIILTLHILGSTTLNSYNLQISEAEDMFLVSKHHKIPFHSKVGYKSPKDVCYREIYVG